jgi:SAM-dependent methyltransferase
MAGHEFDREYWKQHWQDRAGGSDSLAANPPNPQLVREAGGLPPGTALDAGCGAGAEAIWLASHGWQVTAADISTEALARAADRSVASGVSAGVQWVEADLSVWDPGTQFDLVTTHYAHPSMPQLEFYDRIAEWVAPRGTLLIVGHGHGHRHGHNHGHQPPAEASVTAPAVTARLDETEWEVVTAEERSRTLAGREAVLSDVVVRAIRRN